MHSNSLVKLCLAGLMLSGCGSSISPDESSESDLRTPRFSGTYAPTGSDSEGYFSTVRVVQHGPKLALELDGTELALTKLRSGAYTFGTTVEGDPCDNPGCGDTVELGGILWLKKEGAAKRPSVKINITKVYGHPEFDGDLEGEVITTVRWAKK